MTGDYQLLMLVFHNLIKNARQHARGKSLRHTRICITVSRKGKLTVVRISDGNSEISRKIRKRLFEFGAHVSEDGQVKVGLALARLFVEAHPGRKPKDTGVLSYERKGSRNVFTVTIK